MKIRTVVFTLAILLGTAGLAAADGRPLSEAPSRALTVYKTPKCGCCSNHAAFLRARKFDVTVVEIEEDALKDRKRELGMTPDNFSCHTTLTGSGRYFIEGHMPSEAIEKLLAEQPEIRGIALPGMPSASPGMPGKKKGPFVIRQISDDGQVSVFMTL